MSLVDPRVLKQAEILVNTSLKFKKGESCSILADFETKPLVIEIYKLLLQKGAKYIPIHWDFYELSEVYYKNASTEQINIYPKLTDFEMKNVDCYICIAGSTNTRGLTNVDARKISQRQKVTQPITDYRIDKTRWVITRFPTDAQAQEADMSLSDYQDFVFSAINNVDWEKKYKEQEKLSKLLTKTKEVHIIGLETDIRLGKKGRRSVNAGGEFNMPDGEVFTSVTEDDVSGYITYSFPALYMGKEFHKVRLEFKDGKVVSVTAEKGEADLNKILDMDKGARTLGELGIGNNYAIKKFTKDILFDEKIGGTIHLALGKGYKETDSKNTSALHWDMIKDLTKGGELWFDDQLVQKNGKWQIKL